MITVVFFLICLPSQRYIFLLRFWLQSYIMDGQMWQGQELSLESEYSRLKIFAG